MPVSLTLNDGCVAQYADIIDAYWQAQNTCNGQTREVKVNYLISQKHKDLLQRRWRGSWTYSHAGSISSGQDTRTHMKKSHILH